MNMEDGGKMSKRDFLKGLGASAIAGISSSEVSAQNVPLSTEKLPAGTVESLDKAKKLVGNRESADITAIINGLLDSSDIDVGVRNTGEREQAKKLITGSILDWNTNQRLEDRIAFMESRNFPREYSPLFRANGQVPLGQLLSLHINISAIKKFLANPGR